MDAIEEEDNIENETDVITLQRRLQKAIRLADKLKQKYEFEREVSRELAKRNELLKAELNFEEENYRNLSNVFKETCERFGDLLTYQELLIGDAPPKHGSETMTEILSHYDNCADFFTSVKSKAGIEKLKKGNKHYHRTSDGTLDFIEKSGTSLLRRSSEAASIDKTSKKSKRSSISVASFFGNMDNSNHKNPYKQSPRVGTPSDQLPSAEERGRSFSGETATLPTVATDDASSVTVTTESTDALSADLSHAVSTLPLMLQRDGSVVPLFEHFLVIGVPIDVALTEAQRINKQNSMSSRLFQRLGSLLSGSNPKTMKKSNSQVSENGTTPTQSVSSSWTNFSSANSQQAATPPPQGRARMMSTLTTTESQSEADDNKQSSNTLSTSTSTINSPLPPPSSQPTLFSRISGVMKFRYSTTSSTSTTPVVSKSLEDSTSLTLSHEASKTPDVSKPQVNDDDENGKSSKQENLNEEPGAIESVSTRICDENETAIAELSSPSLPPTPLIKLSHVSSVKSSISSVPETPAQPAFTTLSTEPTILYRFPADAEPPPSEVCDFCLPMGGKLKHFSPGADTETVFMEILYGHGQCRRSARCFIFSLEDKTIDPSKYNNSETGEGTGRLFGICVIHPRLLNPISAYKQMNNGKAPENERPGNNNGIEFESSVCYCFITRFPLFNFFFQVIWGIMSHERVTRMELMRDHCEPDYDKINYEYVPASMLESILSALTKMNPPTYNSTLTVKLSSTSSEIHTTRRLPTDGQLEHIVSSADWALPPFVHFVDVNVIARALGMLMCEVKLIVIGDDTAMVACTVVGLSTLLNPLQWVSPMIPILPNKHMDFIDSPVPIIAGLIFDRDLSHTDDINSSNLLKRCLDSDTVTAVLDLSCNELFVLGCHEEVLNELIFPDAEALVEKLKEQSAKIDEASGLDYIDQMNAHSLYSITPSMLEKCKMYQDSIAAHLMNVVKMAKPVQDAVVQERVAAMEEKVRAELERLERMKVRSPSNGDVEFAVAAALGIPKDARTIAIVDGNNRVHLTESPDELSEDAQIVLLEQKRRATMSSITEEEEQENENDEESDYGSNKKSREPSPRHAPLRTVSMSTEDMGIASSQDFAKEDTLIAVSQYPYPLRYLNNNGNSNEILSEKYSPIDYSNLFLRRFVSTQMYSQLDPSLNIVSELIEFEQPRETILGEPIGKIKRRQSFLDNSTGSLAATTGSLSCRNRPGRKSISASSLSFSQLKSLTLPAPLRIPSSSDFDFDSPPKTRTLSGPLPTRSMSLSRSSSVDDHQSPAQTRKPFTKDSRASTIDNINDITHLSDDLLLSELSPDLLLSSSTSSSGTGAGFVKRRSAARIFNVESEDVDHDHDHDISQLDEAKGVDTNNNTFSSDHHEDDGKIDDVDGYDDSKAAKNGDKKSSTRPKKSKRASK